MKRLVVVSRQDVARFLQRTILWRAEVERHFVSDYGAPALEAVRALAPQLVVVDGADLAAATGFISALRLDPQVRDTGVVALLHEPDAPDEEALRSAGAGVVLPTPVEPRVWDARLETLLNVPRRREARVPVRVETWARAEDEPQAVDGYSLNISLNGVLLECARPLEVGTALDLALALPDGESEEAAVVGQVVRAAGDSQPRYRYGIKFLVRRGRAAERIASFVGSRLREAPADEDSWPQETEQWEARLRESEALKAAVIEAALDAIVTMDAEGHVVEFNRAAERLFGYTRNEVVGRRVADTIVPEHLRAAHVRGLARNVSGAPGGPMLGQRVETEGLRRDGTRVPVELAILPVSLRQGRAFTAYIRDLSERHRSERRLEERERHLSFIASQMPGVVWTTDTELRFTSSMGAGLGDLGLEPNQVVGLGLAEFFGTSDPDFETIAHHRRALAGQTARFETVWAGRVYETHVEALRDHDGRVVGTIGVAFDVTTRQQAERALRGSERRYRELYERSLAGVFTTSPEGALLDCNQACARMLGYDSPQELLTLPFGTLSEDLADRQAALSELRERGYVASRELRLRRRDGSTVWVIASASLLADGLVQGTLIDITEHKRAAERISFQAYHDTLTGLPNRALLLDRVGQALAAARRRSHGAALLYLDLDQFKRVNDTLGHAAGDALLREVATRLAANLREDDTVARLGGDEFVVLLPEVHDASGATLVAEKLLEAVARPCHVDGHELHVTTSIGISLFPEDGHDAPTLLREADAALYRAKERGRNIYQLFTAELSARALRRLLLEHELRSALGARQLRLVYQPVAHAADGHLSGVEALLRWTLPNGQEVAPAEFIELAEETRLILPIGEWVLETACAEAAQWARAFGSPVRLAVNVSPRQLHQGSLVATVERVLRDSGLPPAQLELEITESAAMLDAEATRATLDALHGLGVSIAMDDFGAGHAVLSYLQQFRVHTLKIDQAFVRDVTSSSGGAIARAIVEMAHALGLRVVAEGVETRDQLEFLRGCGCDELQGYLVCHPLEPADLLALLARGAPLVD